MICVPVKDVLVLMLMEDMSEQSYFIDTTQLSFLFFYCCMFSIEVFIASVLCRCCRCD